ncbi:hypothetical protein A4A49_44751 [Nicotiana attenuata]|uniref:Uncharacterized protein n=1 Tax=Nicotiana attenuata TaxID=49451 RepID=A0A1J6KN83_NICAT|nr:hypothetical protein A4A49_44751 [Nicotiana attenuata]
MVVAGTQNQTSRRSSFTVRFEIFNQPPTRSVDFSNQWSSSKRSADESHRGCLAIAGDQLRWTIVTLKINRGREG